MISAALNDFVTNPLVHLLFYLFATQPSLSLSSISYFIYLLHNHPSAKNQVQDLVENSQFEVTLSQNWSIATMGTTVMVATASHVANNPPASVGSPIVVPTYLGEPPTTEATYCPCKGKKRGILLPREFQVRAIDWSAGRDVVVTPLEDVESSALRCSIVVVGFL
jgi:hypothetical protein